MSLDIENSGYQFLQWSTTSSSTPVSISSAGLYTVQMLDANFCLSTDTVEVLFSAPSVAASASLIKGCDGDVSTITASGTFDSYIWNSGQSGNSITATETGSYVVTAFDEYSCTAKDTINVEFVEKPILYVLDEPAFSGGSLTGTYASTGKYLGAHNGHEYYVVESQGSWSTAKSAAQALGGHLAIPNDAAENDALAVMMSAAGSNDNAWLGVEWNGSKWLDINGKDLTYTNWWGSTTGSASNGTSYHTRAVLQGGSGTDWYNYNGDGYSFNFIIEFPENRRPLVASETFCDSVQIWTDQSFDSFLWSTGETDSIITVDATTASAITLTGTVNKSDGTTCTLTSDGTSITINTTPTISITNNSGTVDYDGTNSISLTAGSSSSTTGYLWSNGLTTAAISVTAEGTYQVVGTDVGCSDSTLIKIFEPLYVAKTGNDGTGDGSFGSPYLTIQKAIDVASSGDKIYVLPGVYSETVDLDKSVTIESDFVRLDSANAKNTSVIDGNGDPCISIENISDDINVTVNGFTLKDASQTSNANQGAIHINNSSNTTFSLRNSSITQSANSGDCCGRGGIINIENARRVEFISVDIHNNGSLTQEARFPINMSWVSSGVLFENSKISSNGFTQWLFQVYETELTFTNSIIAENTSQWSDRHIFNLEGNNVSLTMNHTTVYSNDQGQEMGLFNISNGTPTVEINNSILDVKEIVNTSEDYTVSNSLLRIGNVFQGNGLNLGSNNIQSNIQLQSGYKLPATSPAIGLGDISLGNIQSESSII